jgi:photosystem II stability/assembly factor-like uncharacterized protein
MKRKHFFVLIILLICCLVYCCTEKSTNPPPPPPPDELNDINNPPGTYINKLAINSIGDIFAATSDGIFISTNRGSRWDTLRLPPAVSILKLTANDVIFISYYSLNASTLLCSKDNGSSWTSLPHPLFFLLSIETDISGNIYISGVGGLFKSTDLGNNWEQLYNRNTYELCILNDSTFVIGIPGSFVGEILYSSDYGNSWDSTDHHVNVIEFYKYNSIILAGGSWGDEGGGGVHKSTDGGICWQSSSLERNSVSSFITNNLNQIFIGTDAGIYFTDDQGTSWQNVLADSVITTLVRDSKDYLYAGTNEGTFLRSTDNGMTWHN